MERTLTQAEIKTALHVLRYSGKWSIRGIAKRTKLSPSTVSAAFEGAMGEQTQARLSLLLPSIPAKAPARKKPFRKITKNKPGHYKRSLITFFNLTAWLDAIQCEPGLTVKFHPFTAFMPKEKIGYVCQALDYQLKFQLLALFGERLREKKIVMADCYPAASWVKRIHETFPGVKTALFKKLMKRGNLK